MEADQEEASSSATTNSQADPVSPTVTAAAVSEGESKLFQLLRPICVAVMKEPTSNNFRQLSHILQDIPTNMVPPQLVEYIIFPFTVHLDLKMRQKLRHDDLFELYNCLRLIASRWTVTSFVIFLELFTRLNIAFGSETEPTKLKQDLVEDILQSLTACLHELISRSLQFHTETMYTPKYAPSIGHCIFMLLQIVTDHKMLSLRLTALDTLDELVKACSENADACRQMFKFLPGLTTGLRKVCSIDGRYYKKLVVRALSTFLRVIKISTSAETSETLQQADINLSVVLRQISDAFMLSEDIHYRLALADFSIGLIESNIGKMPICTEVLWNDVFILACDSNSAIAQRCQVQISSIPPSIKAELASSAVIITSTKRALNAIRNRDENGCLLLLKRISASLMTTSLSSVELSELVPTLVNVISCSLTSSKTSKSLETELELKKGNKVLDIGTVICSNLTLATDLTDILDQLSELLKSVNTNEWVSTCKSAALIFILNSVIHSCSRSLIDSSGSLNTTRRTIESDEAFAMVSTFVTCLSAQSEVVDESLRTATNVQSIEAGPSTDTPTFEFSRAVYEMYLLEGIEVLLALDPESFHPFMLPEVMYILLEHAGREDYLFVSNAALKTLQSISPELSLQQILSENLDLVLNELSLRVKSKGASVHSRLPMAVIFIAKYFDFSQENFVQFVGDIFFQSHQEYQQTIEEQRKRLVLYAQIFYGLISSLHYHSLQQELSRTDSKLSVPSTQEKKPLGTRLLEYQKSVGMSMEDDKEDVKQQPVPENDEEKLEVEVDQDEEKQLPSNPDLALRICTRVIHYLPIDNRLAKLAAMDILIAGVQMLAPYENSLLPLSHQIWEYLVPRFKEPDFVVVRKSFELLLVLCTASKTFLKNRTLTDIFPKLAMLLQRLGEEGTKVKDKNRVYYTTTQAYKLQLCILEGLAELCKSIEVLERDLDRVATGCVLYLKPSQHRNLKDAATRLLKQLGNTTYGSTIWMKLAENGICDIPRKPSYREFRPLPAPVLDRQAERQSRASQSKPMLKGPMYPWPPSSTSSPMFH